ncbi:MAG: hypothetical protein ABJ201_11890, partial [Nisaea sp.]
CQLSQIFEGNKLYALDWAAFTNRFPIFRFPIFYRFDHPCCLIERTADPKHQKSGEKRRPETTHYLNLTGNASIPKRSEAAFPIDVAAQ